MIIENYSTGKLIKHINQNEKRIVIISNRPFNIYGAIRNHLLKSNIDIDNYNTNILYYDQKKTSVHDIFLFHMKRTE